MCVKQRSGKCVSGQEILSECEAFIGDEGGTLETGLEGPAALEVRGD